MRAKSPVVEDVVDFGVDADDAERGTPAAEVAVARRTRQPLNGRSLKLRVFGEVPGYHLHIAKDEGSRISMMEEAGYRFIKRAEVDTGRSVSSYNTDPGGNVRFILGSNGSEPVYGYLMGIPIEFWLEDQQSLEAGNAAIDAQIRGGTIGMTDGEQRYIPKGGVQYDPKSPKFFVNKPAV